MIMTNNLQKKNGCSFSSNSSQIGSIKTRMREDFKL